MTTPSPSSSSPASAKASASAKATADKSADKPARRKASAKAIEILPPLPDAEDWTCSPEDITLPPALEFEPVMLRGGRNMVTPMKQRVFIRVLAETGRICLAAKAAGNTPGSFYYLRNHAAGESFGAAWDRARDFGTGRVLDILLDHAINGVPEYIYKDGVLVAERRRFNHHLMMWLVAHNSPEKFGVHGGLMHGRSDGLGNAARMKQLRAQWEAELNAKHTATEADTYASIMKKLKVLGIRTKLEEAARYVGDPAKRAAWEVLHGPQDWVRIGDYAKSREEDRQREAARTGGGEGDGRR